MGIGDAAQNGDLVLFALVVACAIVVLLGMFSAWMLKDRIQAGKARWDLLEKRLGAGSETMARVQLGLKDIATQIVDLAGRTVLESNCRTCKTESEGQLKDIERRISGWKTEQADLKRELAGLNTRMDQGFKTLSGLLGQLVTIPAHTPDRLNKMPSEWPPKKED